MSIDNSIEEKVLSWILKEKDGLSSEDSVKLNLFLQTTKNKEYYEKYKNLFLECNDLDENEKNSIKELIENDKKSSKLKFVFAPLASGIIFVLFFVFNYYENTKVKYENIFATTNEKKLNILLPDNSLVDLDIKSKIDVKYYNDKRLVNMKQGKVIFSVSKDKERPFTITSKNTRIEVLGTKFEVINLNNIHTINVIEGTVRVSYYFTNKVRNLRVLKQGDSFSLDEAGKVLGSQKVNILNIAKWKEDLLLFENTSLKDTLNEFARYNDFKIVFEDYEISQIKISGIFNIKRMDSFLDSLPEIYPLKIKKENKTIKLLPDI